MTVCWLAPVPDPAVLLIAQLPPPGGKIGRALRSRHAHSRIPGPDDQPEYDWGVAYYMSYDNNLEKCGKPIIKMITAGCKSEKQIVAVQADFTDSNGMKRYTIKPSGTEETKIDTEDSAKEETAIEYLEWFTKTFKCKHYVFTFLDHGGAIDQMCFD